MIETALGARYRELMQERARVDDGAAAERGLPHDDPRVLQAERAVAKVNRDLAEAGDRIFAAGSAGDVLVVLEDELAQEINGGTFLRPAAAALARALRAPSAVGAEA